MISFASPFRCDLSPSLGGFLWSKVSPSMVSPLDLAIAFEDLSIGDESPLIERFLPWALAILSGSIAPFQVL